MALITGGPDWMSSEDRFNVEAKTEDPSKATEDQLYQMLQALLIERFSLKLHREMKDTPGFALVIAKNGPKLKEAMGDDVVLRFGPALKPIPGQPVTLTARRVSMPMLANLLTAMGAPVMDQTGLAAAYDFTLAWNDSDGPQLTTALQEQLGLKFEPRKVPVSYIVIDSAQKPTEN